MANLASGKLHLAIIHILAQRIQAHILYITTVQCTQHCIELGAPLIIINEAPYFFFLFYDQQAVHSLIAPK